MANVQVTYAELLTYADKLGVNVIPWDYCNPTFNRLGSGSSMSVFSGTYQVNGEIHNVAFKLANAQLTRTTRGDERSSALRDIKQEIRIMGGLKEHSRIVQLLGVTFNDHMPILILELARSNLENYLLENHRVRWRIKLGFMYDIALGLEAIHKINVIHGDLKASNILIYDDDNNQVIAKISDFGYSSTDFSVQQGRHPGFSHKFRARESFDTDIGEWNGKPTMDIYSYGLVVYQIAHDGAVPFEDYDNLEIDNMKKVGAELAILLELLPRNTPKEIERIMKETIRNAPLERLNLDEIKKILKESNEWNQVYSYEEARIAFESLSITLQENIYIPKMMELSIPPSLRKSIFLEYQQLAGAGDVVSQQRLGSCWRLGFGTDQNYFRAFECYEKAAEGGNIDAQCNLGYCYQMGQGVTKDYMKAVELFTKAAEAGNLDAQCNLGICYEMGQGVTKDYIKAVELFTKAAEAGNIDAQCCLGVCYYHGHGVTKDYVKTIELFTKAAEAGNVDAQYNLGLCYENGNGVTKDYNKAIELYKKAAAASHTMAKNKLERPTTVPPIIGTRYSSMPYLIAAVCLIAGIVGKVARKL